MSEPDARILGKLIIIQSTLHVMPDKKSLFEFLSRGLSKLPGINLEGVCFEGIKYFKSQDSYHKKIIEENCIHSKTDWDNTESYLPCIINKNCNSISVIELRTSNRLYGYLFFNNDNDKIFSTYKPYLENTANLIALIIENWKQKKGIESNKNKLEKAVAERTSELMKEIHERKEIEKKLREQKKLLRTIYNASKDVAFITTDADGSSAKILTFSPGAEAIFGYSEEEIKGRPVSILHLKEDISSLSEIQKLHDFTENGYSGEFTLVRKNSELFPGLVTIYPLLDETGQRYAGLCIMMDILKLKKAEEEKKAIQDKLRQSQKMEAIGTLAGGIAHDFNNILQSIFGYAELLYQVSEDNSFIRTNTKKIINASNRAKDLIKQILAFSRQTKVESVPVDFALVVNDAVSLITHSIPSSIKIIKNIDAETGIIMADQTQLHQIIINLCTNAVHALESKNGEIIIILKRIQLNSTDSSAIHGAHEGTYGCLTVKDNGPGIQESIISKIFDPFFTTKETGKGTGMGLSIVHGIVKNLGGFIKVDSSLGKGSTFNIFFPVINNNQEITEPVEYELKRGNENILFIDDDPMLSEAGKMMLENLGYMVTAESSSLTALKIFNEHPERFDVIITDQTMPDMTGTELANHFLKTKPDIPIIICTGYATEISEIKTKSTGIKALALKPIEQKEISNIIREVLDNNH